MSWLTSKNPDIDCRKLQAEIDEAFSAFPSPPKDSYLLDNLETYAPGIDPNLNLKRTLFLAPLIRLFLLLLKRILRHQYIFNSLTLEILRNQEKRLESLEENRPDPSSSSH
jgi:hypothetical protein